MSSSTFPKPIYTEWFRSSCASAWTEIYFSWWIHLRLQHGTTSWTKVVVKVKATWHTSNARHLGRVSAQGLLNHSVCASSKPNPVKTPNGVTMKVTFSKLATGHVSSTKRRGRVVSTPTSKPRPPGTNLGPDHGYPERVSWSSSVPPRKRRESILS